ncbi:MAG: hypothetical protein ACW98F_19405 [Candidatus Hodarchaeales archaeon]
MKEKTILSIIDEYTKYFDVCYWKERRLDPHSSDLKNWKARKREKFLSNGFGGRNGC